MSSNIKVGIRVRPLISREKNDKLKEQWKINENCMYPIDPTTGKRNGDIYYFDHIFDSSCCNDDIYSTIVHPVVDKAMNGFNGTIFAYGQTSSGKTYTMMGNANEDGLISKAVQNIFLAIESMNRKFLLRVSYIEIYNEKIYDLLDIKNTVKISEDYNGSVIVNVKEEVTDSAEKVYDIMKKGDKARRIGETSMNEKSSRSHTIFRIIIESSDINDTGVVNVAHLNLVDLAGSERATYTKATGQRLKEGAHINKSLSTLSLVMKQLSESQDFINFRDSKLTRILQPSLGGNALAAIICAVTPAALEETHSTLAFASRAKTVKNKPLLNEVVTNETLINKYALEIDVLKRDLEKANDNRTLQAQKIAVLEKCILFPKKSKPNICNKNRRKTWSAPNDPNRTLPVIYESDILTVTDHLSTSKSDILDFEECPFDDFTESASFPESTCYTATPRSNSSSLLDSKCASNGQPVKKSDDVVKWLIHPSTETPKSVLRERAEYYEHEFTSLKELTSQEKLILTTDYNTEMESLREELFRIKNELKCERVKKKDQEIKFLDEKKILESKLDEEKKKNDELSKIYDKAKKKNEQQNDCEYLVEMYKEKYKIREKELLDSLQEAREQLKFTINNTDDEKNKIISTDLTISLDMKVYLDECKNQLNLLKTELETTQSISVIQKMFNEIKKLNEDMLVNSTDCSDDLQDLLNVFKYMFDLSSIMLSDDTVILDLEREKRQFQHREKTYELLVSKQDEEIKHLSENILQYMNELKFYKNEITKYKEISKLETSLQIDLDFSIMTTDTKNMTDYDINNVSTLNQSELILTSDECEHTLEFLPELIHSNNTETEELSKIFQSDQYVQTKENFPKLINKIEDLSDKIMEYIEQLSAVEQEMNLIKSVSNANQLKLEADKKQMKEKDDVIAELMTDILTYQLKLEANEKVMIEKDVIIAELTTDIRTYDQNIIKQQDQIKEKDMEIKDLSNIIMKYLTKVSKHNDEINITYEQLYYLKKLLRNKDERLGNLSHNLILAEEEIQNLNVANNTVASVDEKVKEPLNLAIILDEYRSDVQSEQNLKDEQIEKLKNQLSDISDIPEKQNLVDITNEEIYEKRISIQTINCKEQHESETRVSGVKEELQMNKLEMEEEQNLVQSKDSQFSILAPQIMELSQKMFILQRELEQSKSLNITKDLFNKELLCNLSAAKNELYEYKTNVEKENAKIRESSTDITSYINQLSIADKMIQELESNLQIQTEFVNHKNTEIEELSNEILDYINQLTTAEEEIKMFQAKLENQDKIIKLKNEENDELSTQIMDYIDQLSTLELKLNSKNTEIINLKEKAIFEKKLIEQTNLEIQELNSKLLDCNKQIKKYQEEIENINSKNASEYLKMEQDLELANETISQLQNNSTQTNVIEELLKKSNMELEKIQMVLQLKETEIIELSELIRLKDEEIKNMTEQSINYEHEILEMNQMINEYMKDLQSERYISNERDHQIQNINEKYSKQIAQYEYEINNLNSLLHEKDVVIVLRENNIKCLNDQINLYIEQVQELNLRIENLREASSDNEILKMKIKDEEIKSVQNVNKIKSLEQQLVLLNEQLKQIIETSNLQYSAKNENVEKQMYALEGHITQLESKLQEQSKYIANLQKELVIAQNRNTELTQDMSKLEKKNEDYRKCYKQMTEHANSKMVSYNNMGVKLKKDKELLKMQVTSEKEKNKQIHNQLVELQNELKKKDSGNNSDGDLLNLQSKINNLEGTNKKLLKVIKEYQEQMYMKGNECSAMKNSVETLKFENLDLHKKTKDLQEKLCESEILLKSTEANLKLLEKEKENYNESAHRLEESLEDVKFELFELKKKEREKSKKAKRQSLHDSSRSLSSDEQLSINVSDENQSMNLPSFESSKAIDIKSSVCERCKSRMPLSGRQIDEQPDKVSKPQNENEYLRKKYEQVSNLCKLRKNKIDELERQVQSYKSQ